MFGVLGLRVQVGAAEMAASYKNLVPGNLKKKTLTPLKPEKMP